MFVLIKEFLVVVVWEKYDKWFEDWVCCDLLVCYMVILFDVQEFQYLLFLVGVVCQLYFWEVDGNLVVMLGYDEVFKFFGVFDLWQFQFLDLMFEVVCVVLVLLEELFLEFYFVVDIDWVVVLVVIFIVVVCLLFVYVFVFYVRVLVFGSGKIYFCEFIGFFVGFGGNFKVSYLMILEEVIKVILLFFFINFVVIEFDDMDIDWIFYGIMKCMLIVEYIIDCVFGVSKMVMVSIRMLFLGLGNNVGLI